MALYRKIKGQDTKVASNGIVYHNDLEGRNSYGAHSIDSIRKLPEKLTELKGKSKANEEAITREISNRAQAIASEAEARNEAIAQEARLRESADTNLSNNINSVRSDTERIKLEEDQINKGKLIFTPAVGDPITVQGGFLPDNTSIILTQDNQLQAKGLVTQTGYLSGDVIKEVISAQGGYLDSHDFGTATPTNQELTDYAIQNIETITEASEIWDKTKVINLYNHHTWVWDLNSETWSDLGEIAQISDANNEGLHGLVTGAPNDGDHDYMGNIDANGQININGLPELAQQVENNTNNISTNAQNISTNTSNISTNTTNISNNTTAINDEISNRQNADSNLQSQISQLDTDKQDKLTAGDHIDITNNVIDIKDVITLGMETQTFTGTKTLIVPSDSNTPTELIFKPNNTAHAECAISVSDNVNYTGFRAYKTLYGQSGIIRNNITISFPSNAPNFSTFAVRSDIPTLDSTPTQDSTNGVTSGGVKSYVDNIVGDIETLLGGI